MAPLPRHPVDHAKRPDGFAIRQVDRHAQIGHHAQINHRRIVAQLRILATVRDHQGLIGILHKLTEGMRQRRLAQFARQFRQTDAAFEKLSVQTALHHRHQCGRHIQEPRRQRGQIVNVGFTFMFHKPQLAQLHIIGIRRQFCSLGHEQHIYNICGSGIKKMG